MITNDYGIDNIVIYLSSNNYCTLGRDWYTANIEVKIMPDKFIPDYCEVDKYIQDEVSGKHFIIEQVVEEVFKYFETTYNPLKLNVTVKTDNATHSAVEVSKSKREKAE